MDRAEEGPRADTQAGRRDGKQKDGRHKGKGRRIVNTQVSRRKKGMDGQVTEANTRYVSEGRGGEGS